MDELVLAPWKEIVSQGKAAADNAETVGNERMLKAAQGLVKEGERALKRLEPLCQRNVEEYGATFVNALKSNEEISQFIEQLNSLLYDFEEYVDAENFDAGKVADLQELSKRAAPRICHIITVHLRLESAANPHAWYPDAIPTGSSPTVETPYTHAYESTQGDVLAARSEHTPYPEDYELDFQVKYALSFANEAEDLPQASSSSQQRRPSSSRQGQVSPALPSTPDPWLSSAQEGLEVVNQNQQRPAGSGVSRDSATGLLAPCEPPGLDHQSRSSLAFRVTPAQPSIPDRSPNRTAISVITNPTHTLSPSLLELNRHFVGGRESMSSTTPRIAPSRDSVGSSTATSIRSSTSNYYRHEQRDSFSESVSPTGLVPRALPSPCLQREQHGRSSPLVAPLFSGTTSPSWSMHNTSELIEPMALPAAALGIEDGLIPVLEDQQPVSSPLATSSSAALGGCAVTMSSSFSQFKGFCPGAIEAIHGGLGIRHIKKQGLTTATIEVAKCKDCLYELEWDKVRRDIGCEASENFTSKSAGIGFRLRFFSKSHLPTKSVGEQTYGCLFCIQLRQTTHPNDATVFFSQRQLFAHLARHPRPLPRVPDLTVIETQDIPANVANNYDLHVPPSSGAPKVSPLVALSRDLAGLPTATALTNNRPTPAKPAMRITSSSDSSRKPNNGATKSGEVLSFATGAKLVGIEFPDRSQGLWCMGWADHTYGAIPFEAIQLDAPRGVSNAMRRLSSGSANGSGHDGVSGTTLKAVARWRFTVKEKEKTWGWEWLAFGKGEVITNIGWSYQDHWCWWGTNSKGKRGMFPRAFIEPNTLMEFEATSDHRSGSASSDRKSSLFSRISLRRG